MQCPNPKCRMEIDDDSLFCSECGAEIDRSSTPVPPTPPTPPSPPPVNKNLLAVLGVVVIVIVAGVLGWRIAKKGTEKEEIEVVRTDRDRETDEQYETNKTPIETEDVSDPISESVEEEETDETVESEEPTEEETQQETEAPRTFEAAIDREKQQEMIFEGDQLDAQQLDKLITKANADYGAYILDISNMEEYDVGYADVPMPASALIGVPILFTIADGVDSGSFSMDTLVTFHYTFEYGRGIFTKKDDGKAFPVSQMLSAALVNSDNNALNSLMDLLTLDYINSICHYYGFDSVDMQRKLMNGTSDKENYISAKDAALMLNAVYQDNFDGLGSDFLERYFRITDADESNMGMYKACSDCDIFLNLNGVTASRYNEIGLVKNGDEVFILSVFTCEGDGEKSAKALTKLTSYVVDTLEALER